jgi:S-adenosylmethionine:tRNA ribosyltransferase-isomerase
MRPFPFDYDLPPELIAQEPCEPRDRARLLVARRSNQSLTHNHFYELPDLLQAGDLLVLNDTRVVPARLFGKRARTGGKWEGLFLRELPDSAWELICQTRGTLHGGEMIQVTSASAETFEPVALELLERLPGGRWKARPHASLDTFDLLERYGHLPLPPYIRKGTAGVEDRNRYQTVYAQQAGAIAAPTAGLHFTPHLFDRLKGRGIGWTTVTLHAGLATFQPIQVEDYTQHPMHTEWGRLTQASVEAILACKAAGHRVVAVGTTSVRVLESVARLGPLSEWTGETNLYIHPPYDFKVVDGLITNFHLPRTTLLLLVAAFAGVQLVISAYQAAIAERYRFYSYGDAMLIL